MPRFISSLSILGLILLLASASTAQDSTPKLDQLTYKVREVIENRSYTCLITINRPLSKKGQRELYYELVHSYLGFLFVQPLTRGADGKFTKTPVYFICNNNGRFLIDPDRKVAVENPRAWGGVREILDEGPFRNFMELPSPKITVRTLGNRETYSLVSEGGDLSYEFFVDKSNSFPLKYELYSNAGTIFSFEVTELEFIEPTEIDDALFEIPVGFIKPPKQHRFMGGPGGGKPPWLPLVPSKESLPEEFDFDTLRPHFIKGALVYQAVFVNKSTSEIVSVFQTMKPGLSKTIESHIEGSDLRIVTLEKDGILLIAIGSFQNAALLDILEAFNHDDNRARQLMDAGREALDWGG